ncbi:hypothetical protein L1987_32224 [Smallanthus sonchifolius]|uniref:Uncharacterized protein n=1 Tax=Smallanthus sonchifolius TaxID=185202 RepID=A0ACB9I9A0_9ASTR|nr:hypothetical protein L1987_32224 [Smallanthus sonchifolius]
MDKIFRFEIMDSNASRGKPHENPKERRLKLRPEKRTSTFWRHLWDRFRSPKMFTSKTLITRDDPSSPSDENPLTEGNVTVTEGNTTGTSQQLLVDSLTSELIKANFIKVWEWMNDYVRKEREK